MTKTYFIYILINPKNGDVFYVGCTSSLVQRRVGHGLKASMDTVYSTSGKSDYIKQMGCDPLLVTIDKIETTQLEKNKTPKIVLRAEAYWIEKFMDMGVELTNKNWHKEHDELNAKVMPTFQ